MPRSSRNKSHKQQQQSKHSSDEDVKMKDRSSNGGSDRWNGGSTDDKENNNKESLKVVGESKSSRRHDGDDKDKRKYDKESGRKEREYKESKEKDRGRKGHSDKVGAQGESHSSKRGKDITEWPIEEELRNPELEKELKKRMRRRGEASSDKDKYQDSIKETEDRRLSSRTDCSKDERHKNEDHGDIRETRQKDEKHREDSERDRKNRDVKHRGESEKSSKHRDDKYREDKYSEDGNKETKYKDDRYIETNDKDERSRDRKRRQDDDRDYRHKEEKRSHDSKYHDAPEPKRLRDDNAVYDDRVSRYKDDKDRRRVNEKDESSDYRSRSSVKEQSEVEKRSSAKDDSVSERGRLDSRYADVEVTTSHTRCRSSPSGSSYSTRDHHRTSKQEETKYSDYAYEERARYNVHSSRDYNSAPGQSDKNVTSKDDSYRGGDLQGEKRMRPESRSSPQVDKSLSSSNEHRNINKSDARKNLDHKESGPGLRVGGSKDTFKDGKGSRELNEAHINNDFSHVDSDNLSASSPYSRNSHVSEDDRSKSNNRHRRMADQHMNRGQSQMHSQIQSQNQGNWKNVPNWPPPMATGGYIPFQHVPPPMFHPLMQQFPPTIFGRPPMKLNPGLPYPVSDHGRPVGWRNQLDESVAPPLHGWDANNPVFGDESHLYGRLDWDRRSQGWDQSGEMWKGQNAENMGQQKDEYSGHRPNDENLTRPTGQPDESEQNQLDIQPETLNLDKNGPNAQKPTGSPKNVEVVNEDNTAIITRSYLSRVDVSKDLTQPELYDQCISMMDLDPEDFSQPVDFDCKILYLEESVEANVTDSASLFTAINDSVFQKAMFLYNKQKEELDPTNTDKDKDGSDDDGKPAEEAADVDTVMEINKESDEPPNKPEEPVGMEVDHAVVKQEEAPESSVVEVNESLPPSASGSLLPCKIEDETNDGDKNAVGGGGGGGGESLVLSDVSTAEVAVMPTESIEFGSVNLNRIHHLSPESTH
ncbi:uncharacterized protein LOC143600734 [Bidens hawaiensis]|uniref:uncharacterized protein LOC143600734 n=1 Tax=Bidens hawaiensis TaxID=980011 RepID=UPI00404AB2EC